MGWGIGEVENRDVGYGVPAYCDHPGCTVEIDRGLGYACGEEHGHSERGCGLYFCQKHSAGGQCERCAEGKQPFNPSPDHPTWIRHKLTDESWQAWRDANPAAVARLSTLLTLSPEREAEARRRFENQMRADGVTNFDRTPLGRYTHMVLEWTWLGWRDAVRTGAAS